MATTNPKVIFLLDVDQTLILSKLDSSNYFNNPLISALRLKQQELNKQGIECIFHAFTNMSLSDVYNTYHKQEDNYISRPHLVNTLINAGLNFKSVITPADRKRDRGLGNAYATLIAPQYRRLDAELATTEGEKPLLGHLKDGIRDRNYHQANQEFNRLLDFSDYNTCGIDEMTKSKASMYQYTVSELQKKYGDDFSVLFFDDKPEFLEACQIENQANSPHIQLTTVPIPENNHPQMQDYYSACIDQHTKSLMSNKIEPGQADGLSIQEFDTSKAYIQALKHIEAALLQTAELCNHPENGWLYKARSKSHVVTINGQNVRMYKEVYELYQKIHTFDSRVLLPELKSFYDEISQYAFGLLREKIRKPDTQVVLTQISNRFYIDTALQALASSEEIAVAESTETVSHTEAATSTW